MAHQYSRSRYWSSPRSVCVNPAFNGILTLFDCFLVGDRKSTRLNSSHLVISYAVFCLKKKIDRVVHRAGQVMIDLVGDDLPLDHPTAEAHFRRRARAAFQALVVAVVIARGVVELDAGR